MNIFRRKRMPPEPPKHWEWRYIIQEVRHGQSEEDMSKTLPRGGVDGEIWWSYGPEFVVYSGKVFRIGLLRGKKEDWEKYLMGAEATRT